MQHIPKRDRHHAAAALSVRFLLIVTIALQMAISFNHLGKPLAGIEPLIIVDGEEKRWSFSFSSKVKQKKCIAIGMFTRSVEFDLRQWQRDLFQKHGNSNQFSPNVDIRLRFGMANPSDDPQLSNKIREEAKRHDDLLIFDFQETEECMFANRCLARNHDSLFRGIEGLCDDNDYHGSYFIKIDNDSVLNYELMARVFMNLPTESLVFGRLLPNSANQGTMERLVANFAQSYFPVWPHGSFQGFSKDLLQETLKPENVATILRTEVDYIFPWSDRATGMELERAQIPVKHKVFMKGQYFMCPSESFDCNSYWNSIAFHSGFGWSGKGDDKMQTKLRMMNQIYETQSQCRPPYEGFHQEDHFFFADDDFIKNGNTTYWLSYGCSELNEKGHKMLKSFERQQKEAEKSLAPVYGQCAATLYQQQIEVFQEQSIEVVPAQPMLGSTEGRLSDFSKALVTKMKEDGPPESALDQQKWKMRMKYIKEDHLSNSFHYFCPHGCEADGSNLAKCSSSPCDRELEYLERYPDVAAAVRNGSFANGLEHYIKEGSKGGRLWSCHSRFIDEGEGTKEGCHATFSNFIEHATPLIQDWPISGAEQFAMEPPACNSLVIVEGRDHQWMDFVLRNHRRYLGPYWMFYLVGPKEVADIWRRKYSGPMITVVEIPERFGTLSRYPDDYNQLLLSEYLWKETLQCENVLVTQTDALLFRHGIEDFLKYDYVGSPISSESFPTRYWRIMNAFNDTRVGGNGGFSFRKRTAMLSALQNCPIPIDGSPEDAWSSACMLLLDKSLPHPTMANRFGVGTKCGIDVPFGGHKLWMNCKKSSCVMALLQSRLHRDLYGEQNSNHFCLEGETMYLALYPDVAEAVRQGGFKSGWEHYSKAGHLEGSRMWRCLYPPGEGEESPSRMMRPEVTAWKCPKGEELYLDKNPDVAQAVEDGSIKSGWVHYNAFGQTEGRSWECA